MTVVTLVHVTPRWVFHLLVAALAGWLLVSASVPGRGFFSFYIAGFALCGAAVVWLVMLIMRDRDRRPSWWFAVGPVGAVIVLALLATDAPLQVRWELSQPRFDAAVRS